MRSEIITNIVLLVVIMVCVVVVWLYVKSNNQHEVEHYVDNATASTPGLVTYGIFSLADARAIVDGTWNETWNLVPKNNATILYYSVFSERSRAGLAKSPYTWTNYSPVFAAKLPENCKIDDSKIVFVNNAFIDNTVLGMYTKGIGLNNNRGNGPLAMNMGLNTSALGVVPGDMQRYSIATLVRFSNLNGFTGQTLPTTIELANMKANTPNNNGLTLSLNLSNVGNSEFYDVSVSVAVGADTTAVAVTQAVTIKTYPNIFYAVGIVRNGGVVRVTLHEIDTVIDDIALKAGAEITYTNNFEFSNMPFKIAPNGGLNIVNMMAICVVQAAYTDAEYGDMMRYWRSCAVRTSPVAYALCQQALALRACPFGDSNVCNTCSGVTDWRNVNQLLTAPTECKQAYSTFCLSNSTVPGCECYGTNAMSNQACATWRNIIGGTSACTQTDIDNYLKNNNVCRTSNSNNVDMTAYKSNMERIRDYITAEDYYTDVTIKPVESKGFWEWLFGL